MRDASQYIYYFLFEEYALCHSYEEAFLARRDILDGIIPLEVLAGET